MTDGVISIFLAIVGLIVGGFLGDFLIKSRYNAVIGATIGGVVSVFVAFGILKAWNKIVERRKK